jgi:HK97 family phage portal protein
MTHVLLWGNGYAKIIRNRFGEPKELRILLPWEVTPKMTERKRVFYEVHYDETHTHEVIVADNILHFKNLGTNGLVGISPISIQRENIANSMAKQQHEGAFYVNGAKASGILMTPGNFGPKETANVKESFDKAHSGSKNRFKTIVLEEGVKYQQLTIPQNDAQFLESKKFDQTEICGWFRVPPHMVANLTDANYSNIESQDRSFAKHTMAPWTTRMQLELDRKLFFEEERGTFLTQFNLDDITKGDIKARYEAWNTGIQAGFIKPKWATESEGWPTDNAPEQDQFFMNGTMRPVKLLIKEAEAEKAAPQANTNKQAAA